MKKMTGKVSRMNKKTARFDEIRARDYSLDLAPLHSNSATSV